jgi:hypothetical protein
MPYISRHPKLPSRTWYSPFGMAIIVPWSQPYWEPLDYAQTSIPPSIFGPSQPSITRSYDSSTLWRDSAGILGSDPDGGLEELDQV